MKNIWWDGEGFTLWWLAFVLVLWVVAVVVFERAPGLVSW